MSSAPTDELPPQQDPDEALFGLVSELDHSREDFLDACSSYFTKPSYKASHTIDTLERQTTLAMDSTLTFMIINHPNMTLEERLKAAGTLLFNEDSHRVNRLNDATGTHNFYCAAPSQEAVLEEFAELVEFLADTPPDEAFVDGLMQGYHSYLLADIARLKMLAPDLKEPRAKQMGILLGKHALDVAKIGAGVIIGGWLLRQRD